MSYRVDRIVTGLLRPINPYGSIILGLLTATWGAWILMPWQVFTSAPLFSQMHAFAPEWAWGTWALICGSLIVISVFKGLYKWLYRSLGFAIWHWGTVSSLMWMGDWHNTGGVTYSFICIFCMYLYLNIKVNYNKMGEDIPNFYS